MTQILLPLVLLVIIITTHPADRYLNPDSWTDQIERMYVVLECLAALMVAVGFLSRIP